MLVQRVQQWAQDWRERSFVAGFEHGIKKGIAAERQTFVRQAHLHYDAATADTLVLLLERIRDTEQLAQIGKWIIQYEAGEDLLARIRDLLRSH